MLFRSLACLIFLLGFAPAARAVPLRDPTSPEALRVVVLVNANSPDSLAVARHYCQRRGIPQDNIVSLPMPLSETITWAEFVQTIWEPLAQALEAGAWVDWVGFTARDVAGRQVHVTNHHAVSYLVLCKGVPLRVSHNPDFVDKTLVQQLSQRAVQLQVNQASVDSELALMPQLRPPLAAYVPNPLYANQVPTQADYDSIFRVSRLDGPTQEAALGLVDRAMEAEARGLVGTAYVDSGGLYPEGDTWFEQTAQLLRAASFEVVQDKAPTTFPAELVLASPILYFGWYSGDINGPFALPRFRFPPGAIAYHLHSFSATTLRSATQGWAGPLVEKGAAVTFGNVYEPYLGLTMRPDVFVRALLRGWTVGAAGACAQPAQGWQNIMIGDPLYRPLLVNLDQQVRRIDTYDSTSQAHIRARNALRQK